MSDGANSINRKAAVQVICQDPMLHHKSTGPHERYVSRRFVDEQYYVYNDVLFQRFKQQKCITDDADCQQNGAKAANRVPSDVKFFDLQAMRFASPVFDILHFIYTSTKRDLRDLYTTHLLEIYALALSSNLEEQFTHSSSDLDSLRDTYSLPNITTEYYKHVLYGLAICMWILPAVTFDPNNIPNLDAISEMNRSAKEIKCTQKLTPEYHSRLRDLALEFYQNGYLNLSHIDDQ